MKLAVLVLLLANLAVFAWLRWVHESSPGPDAGLVAPPAGGTEIRLLAPQGGPPAPAARPPGTPSRCLLVGPMPDATAARAATSAARAAGLPVRTLRRERTVTQSYQVLLGGFRDRSAAESTAAGLRRAGVADIAVVAAAGQGAVISAGLFRLRADARRRVERLRKLGYSPQVQEHTRTANRHYLVLPSSTGARAVAAAAAATAVPAECADPAAALPDAGAPGSAAHAPPALSRGW